MTADVRVVARRVLEADEKGQLFQTHAADKAPVLARAVLSLSEALRRIEHWPFDVMREAHEDLADIRECARQALAVAAGETETT